MWKIITLIVVVVYTYFHFQENYTDTKPKPQPPPPAACDATTTITGKSHNILGSSINVRTGAGVNFERVVNKKASENTRNTAYVSINDTLTVYEECTKGDWSWVRVTDPEHLGHSYRGWVSSQFVDKGQDLGDDPYARKISSTAIPPFTAENFPTYSVKYRSRLSEMDNFRRKAAEMAVDSGKCDYVLMSALSDSRSTINHLKFWVDCKNESRIYLDEFEIKNKTPARTQKESSWDKRDAIMACWDMIEERTISHKVKRTSSYKAPTTHNVVISVDFDALNAYGVKIPYAAKCYFPPNEAGTIEVRSR
ncbi:SH3 domain-containing protein [Oceanisphaera sp. IT1-181]|uniref:SH3 domain-containing protein n=1 Tax=Oceanisphaera sp. IT1-181 TaxID=3081199 RepID=UPI0029C9F35B|nr:SH3 domain-containing protein [Oceanisphaera sp. IT1-181]